MTRASIYPEMPQGYEKLDSIEVVEKDGSLRYNGVINLGGDGADITRRVLLPDLNEMWGHDPGDFEEYKANSARWERDQAQHKAIQELARRVEELEQRSTSYDELKKENERLTARVETLEKKLREKEDGLGTGKDTATSGVSDDVDTNSAQEDGPKQAVAAKKDIHPFPAAADENPKGPIGEHQSTSTRRATIRPSIHESQSKLGQRWNELTGKLGNLILGRQVEVNNSEYQFTNKKKRTGVLVTEEIVDGQPESSRRAGIAAVVAAAAVAVTGVACYFIGAGNGVNHEPELKSDNLATQVDFFNSKRRLTGVGVPSNLHLQLKNNHYRIVDSQGRIVVGQLKNGVADRQGNLSVEARAVLRSRGYKLAQGHIGQRYQTFVYSLSHH